MIEIEKLNKSFGDKRVIQDIDLTVPAGQSLAVFGPNGAGKSTLIGILSGVIRPNSGKIRIQGTSMDEEPAMVRRRIGLVSHQPLLYSELTARENLSFYGRMFDVGDLSQAIPDLLKRVGLELRIDDPVRTYSRGMVQRLAIARALLHTPSILLLDEPFTGLDQQASQCLEDVIARQTEKGTTIIMATHDLQQGFDLCQRLLIIKGGRIVFDARREDLKADMLADVYNQRVSGGQG